MSLFSSERVIDQKKYNELVPGDIFIVEQTGIGDDPYEVYSIWWMFNHPIPGGSLLFSPLIDTEINGVKYNHANLYTKSLSPFSDPVDADIDNKFKFYTVDCCDYVYAFKDQIEQRGNFLIHRHIKEGEKMEPRHVNEGEDNMPKSDMNTAGYVSQETVEPCETPVEHAYSENSVKELITSVDKKLDALALWMERIHDRIKILEKRERFKEALENQLDLHDDDTKSQLIQRSNDIGGYFSTLVEDNFPINPWSDDVTIIPANTAELEWDTESGCFCQSGEYTNYNCITKIKTVKTCNGHVYGSIACGADDEISWYDLTEIKEKLNPCADSACNYVYEIDGDGIEPTYIETYARTVLSDNEFVFFKKVNMSGIKYITIVSTCITAIDNDPIALVKIRCRDDEDFTGTWIKYSDLMKMN